LKGAHDRRIPQRITLLDAPGTLGWGDDARDRERGFLEIAQAGSAASYGRGFDHHASRRPLANLLFGALCEAAMTIARSPHQPTVARLTRMELRRLLGAIGAPSRTRPIAPGHLR